VQSRRFVVENDGRGGFDVVDRDGPVADAGNFRSPFVALRVSMDMNLADDADAGFRRDLR